MVMKKPAECLRILCIALVSASATISAHGATLAERPPSVALQPDVVGGYASGHVLVKFAPSAFQAQGTTTAPLSEPVGHLPLQLSPALQADCDRLGIGFMNRCHPRNFANPELAAELGLDRTFIVDVPQGIDAPALVAMLKTHPDQVVSAELDIIGEVAGFIPDDLDFPLQWGMNNTGQTGGTSGADIRARDAWNLHTGNLGTVTLAIIDSGVTPHTEFSSRMLLGFEVFTNGGVECQTLADCADDICPHGTHVTGIAAAEGNNGIGVAGMSWGVNILPVDVLPTCSGTMSQCADGIIWAVDNGADICSLSLQYYSDTGLQDLQDAVMYADAQGVLVVAAAGNNFDPRDTVAFPARFSSVLAVSATDHNDLLPGFSNFGDEIDLAAPGDNIWSTWPLPNNSYRYLDGTSMATPHVSGLAALLMSYNTTLTHSEIREILTCTADDIGAAGWDRMFGYGRINAFQAMLAADPAIARIDSTDAPGGSIDARQPFLPDGTNVDGWNRINVVFDKPLVDHPVPNLFTIQQNGGVEPSPVIDTIIEIGTNTYAVVFDKSIEPGAWTRLRYDISCSTTRLGYLPGDVNGSGTGDMNDVVAHMDALRGSVVLQEWQNDINRDGDIDPADLLRLIDLMIGADAYPQYFGQSLPQ